MIKKIITLLLILLCTAIPAFTKNVSISTDLNQVKNLNQEYTYPRNIDEYEPIPKHLQSSYIKKISPDQIDQYKTDVDSSLKKILYQKQTYNNKTYKQMLLDFKKESKKIYDKYLKDKNNINQNKIFIEQLNEMEGIISLYPNAIIEQLQPIIDKYQLDIVPGSDADIILYKYYIKTYSLKYSQEFKNLLELKEQTYASIHKYILEISNMF